MGRSKPVGGNIHDFTGYLLMHNNYVPDKCTEFIRSTQDLVHIYTCYIGGIDPIFLILNLVLSLFFSSFECY